jgi:putative hydrolase of the HAD superfamily
MMDLEALIFDVNGTLIDIETDESLEQIYRAIGHFLAYQGISLRRWQVRDLYFQVMKEQFEATSETFPEFDVVAVWREIVDRHATDYTRALPLYKLQQLPLCLAEMQRGIARRRLALFSNVREMLDHMKERYRLAVVSDAQTAYAIPELRFVGVNEYFEPIVISGDYGYRKPDPRLFLTALDALHVRPDQAVFIGNDRYRDVFGAQQVRMKTILFCPNGCPGRAGDAEPDYIIRDFEELPRALEYFEKVD